MEDWKETVRKIRQIKLELSSTSPAVGPALAPAPGAEAAAIDVAERRLRRRLPPSYRAFLREHDGWPLLFQGASLLGTRQLSRTGFAELTMATFAAYETTLAEMGARAWREGGAPMIPFGMDPTGSIIFAFNPAMTNRQGEMEVVFWINGLGDRCRDFPELLALVLEMLTNDLAEREARAQGSGPNQVALRQTA
jgi:hypothetical protein